MCLHSCCVLSDGECICGMLLLFFFFKQKTAYEMRISDWSSDVCSSDLRTGQLEVEVRGVPIKIAATMRLADEGKGSANTLSWNVSRSEERRVGKECVSTCRSRWSTYH